ncbi:MAG: serpin family protein [Anaerolineae bacterium]
MKNLLEFLSALAVLSLLLSACGSRPSADVARSTLDRVRDPAVPQADVAALVKGNNGFALQLYRSLHSEDGNLAFSPYSISVALAMPYAGARGDTAAQMARTLHYTLPQDKLHPAFNRLDQDLAKQAEPSSKDEHPLQLKIANAVWAEKTFTFLQDYLDLIARNYGAGVQLSDFVNNHEAVRQQINKWVSQQTNDKIKDLIPQGALDAMTRMVLVNAIYFKADWLQPFDPNDTSDAPFHLLDGSQVQTKMMSNQLSAPYAAGEGYQAVELAYSGETAAMDIIVPDDGRFADFEAGLDAEKLDSVLGSLQPGTLELSMPKFTFRSSLELGDRLAAMGMADAFNADAADFSGMTGKRDLYISKVLHQAFIAVDEKGTEAAAATAVIMRTTSALVGPQKLVIDRPFIFVIRDLESGQILFMGRVLDPTK